MNYLTPRDANHGHGTRSPGGSVSGLSRSSSIFPQTASPKHRGSLFPSSVTGRKDSFEDDFDTHRMTLEAGMTPRFSVSRGGEITMVSGRKSRSREPIISPAWKALMKCMFPIITGTQMSIKEADVTEITGKRKKSFSNPETIENFQREKHVRLEEEIKLKHLEQLMEEFDVHDPEDIWVPAESGYFPPKLVKRIPGCMNVTEFQETIAKVLGTNEYDDYLGKLFTKLDTSCDGYVDWNEFCTYMLLLYRENDYLRSKKEIPFLQEPKIRHIVQNRQEQTTKMIAIDNPTKFVTISREGIMSVWNPNMQFERSYNVSEDDDESQKRRFKMWVTDAVYMQNCHKLAICSTSRDIRFYDVSATSFFEEFHLFAMTDVPYCLDYWYDVKNPGAESLLIFGLDSGDISLLHFKRPLTQLFETPFLSEGGAQKIFVKDLPQHSKWVTHKVLQKIHPELIRQVRYIPDSDAIISSSGCSRSAVVIADVCGLKKNYVFRIEKGVECFDHNRNLNILVTGSIDHYIRVWNPYVTSKPTAILTGHSTGVIGITIHEEFAQVFSYSKDAVGLFLIP
ncbi:WD repeat-containing protein on Y chromosome [Patella vulgata]|uniref:WD repeat-containing protein on Y chromosome n=1 Tax=Patella vulgata TaxID=6465 RepID=UPI00217FB918|nr:WD repeat-containing protein on Y chromosome [Patella vulgata]